MLSGPPALIIPHRPHLLCWPPNGLLWRAAWRLSGHFYRCARQPLPSHHLTVVGDGLDLQRRLQWRPWWGNGWGVYTEHQQLFWCLLAIRETEDKPAIDKANSLVPHSPPSRPPLNAHQCERLAFHTEDHSLPVFVLLMGGVGWGRIGFCCDGGNSFTPAERMWVNVTTGACAATAGSKPSGGWYHVHLSELPLGKDEAGHTPAHLLLMKWWQVQGILCVVSDDFTSSSEDL